MYDRTSLGLVGVVTIVKKAKNYGNGGNRRLGGVNYGQRDFRVKY
jgi:hypothetical protein